MIYHLLRYSFTMMVDLFYSWESISSCFKCFEATVIRYKLLYLTGELNLYITCLSLNDAFCLKVSLCYLVLASHTSLLLVSIYVLYSFPFIYFKPFIVLTSGSWGIPSEDFCLFIRVYSIHIYCLH